MLKETAILVGEGIPYLESVFSLILRRICDMFAQWIVIGDVCDLQSAVCSNVRCLHCIVQMFMSPRFTIFRKTYVQSMQEVCAVIASPWQPDAVCVSPH